MAIYVNNTQVAPALISQINLPFTDVAAISIQVNSNVTKKDKLVVNVYNPGGASIIWEVSTALAKHLRHNEYDVVLLAGDFNCHHPLWNPRHRLAHDEAGDELIEAASDLKLELLLLPGTVTYPQAKTAIDLVWGNDNAALRLLKCRIASDKDFGSDHLPIETIVGVAGDREETVTPPYNYSKTDWKKFSLKLSRDLPPLANIQNAKTKVDVKSS